MNQRSRNPWAWVPSLYFAEGVPYVIAMVVSVTLYKKMGVSNAEIALYTSWLYLPWVIKPLWSPLVDILKTKRHWIIAMQMLVGAGLAHYDGAFRWDALLVTLFAALAIQVGVNFANDVADAGKGAGALRDARGRVVGASRAEVGHAIRAFDPDQVAVAAQQLVGIVGRYLDAYLGAARAERLRDRLPPGLRRARLVPSRVQALDGRDARGAPAELTRSSWVATRSASLSRGGTVRAAEGAGETQARGGGRPRNAPQLGHEVLLLGAGRHEHVEGGAEAEHEPAHREVRREERREHPAQAVVRVGGDGRG